jgi:chitinase
VRNPFVRGRLIPLAAVPALLSLALIAPGASAQTNLLTNGNFSTGSTSGWTCDAGTAAVVTSPVYTGSSYALAGTPTNSDDAQCSQVVSVQPSSSYSLSGWVEGDYVFLGDSGTGTSATDDWTPSATTWTELSTSFTTGASTTSVTIYIHGWYAQPTYYADALSLTGPAGSGGGGGGGGGTAPAAPTGLTVTGTTSSSVSLSWTAPSGTVTGYYVFENGTQNQSVTGTSATVSGLAASTSYTFTVEAYNSVGTSAQSSQVSATTSASSGGGGGGSSGLPAHLLMGYWQDFTNGADVLTLAQVPTTYNLVAVAFGDSDSTAGQVTFSVDSGLSSASGGYTQAQFISDIKTLQARGQKVILSVGGEDGTIEVDSTASAAAFASSVYSLIQQYGFNGVDIDLENGVDPTYMASALEQLQSDVGSSLIITLAPQTVDTQSTGDDYFELALDIKSILTMINTQYYNSGTMNGCDGNVYAEGTENFITALACTELEGGLSPAQVGLGEPASSSAAPDGGYVSPSVVNDALDCLAAGQNCGSFVPPTTWPGIRGVMDWDINWDASSGYAFADTVAPYLTSLP